MPEFDPNRMFIDKIKEQQDVRDEREVVPPIFLLGSTATSSEIILGDQRVRVWKLTGNEDRLIDLANWEPLEPKFDTEYGSGAILIPEGTRNASSVLSGVEAWSGEKKAIIEAAAKYVIGIKNELGDDLTDENLSWNSIGVTPDHKVFIAPPNQIQSVPKSGGSESERKLFTELEFLLDNDETNKNLADEFKAQINIEGQNANAGTT